MNEHDLAGFAAMLLSGIVGALLIGPFGKAMMLAAKRVRIDDRDRR